VPTGLCPVLEQRLPSPPAGSALAACCLLLLLLLAQ
jgi:hypothetical protein